MPLKIIISSFCGIFGQNLVTGVAANRWNVGHVLRCLRPHRPIALNVSALCIYLSLYMEVSFYTCLESYLKSKS